MTHHPSPAPGPRTFTWPVRVYYADTDAGGVVYHSTYLDFFERCRTEWLRHIGHDMPTLTGEHGLIFVVRSINIEYLLPARLDDLLTIGLDVEKIGRSQVVFRQQAWRPNPEAAEGFEALTTAAVQIVCVDVTKMKSTPIPEWLRAKFEALQ